MYLLSRISLIVATTLVLSLGFTSAAQAATMTKSGTQTCPTQQVVGV